MTEPSPAGLVVVAATGRELEGAARLRAVECGIGPVEAAARTAAALAAAPAGVVLHVGIAGARRDSGIGPLEVVVGSESVYCDAGPARPLTPDPDLFRAVREALPGARAVPIGTSARVGGTSGTPVEAMEGYAVLLAARLAGIPAIEVRVVSNEIEEPDRSRWRFDEAFARIAEITRSLGDALT